MVNSRDGSGGPDSNDSGEQEQAPRRWLGGLAGTAGSLLTGLASQAAVLTAVLFYFGWARERATLAYFGVSDLGVLNFSVADYVLRSVGTALPMLMAIGFLAIGAFTLHGQVGATFARNRKLKGQVIRALAAAGGLLVTIGFALALLLTGAGGSQPEGPALMVIGLLLASYALRLRGLGRRRGSEPQLILVLWALALIALLWSTTGYADYIGSQAARQLQSGLPGAANVVVYSSADLSLAGPGISEARLNAPGGAYHFRYSGLRLLVSTSTEYFLLPAGWRRGLGSVIILPQAGNGGAMRVEFQEPRAWSGSWGEDEEWIADGLIPCSRRRRVNGDHPDVRHRRCSVRCGRQHGEQGERAILERAGGGGC